MVHLNTISIFILLLYTADTFLPTAPFDSPSLLSQISFNFSIKATPNFDSTQPIPLLLQWLPTTLVGLHFFGFHCCISCTNHSPSAAEPVTIEGELDFVSFLLISSWNCMGFDVYDIWHRFTYFWDWFLLPFPSPSCRNQSPLEGEFVSLLFLPLSPYNYMGFGVYYLAWFCTFLTEIFPSFSSPSYRIIITIVTLLLPSSSSSLSWVWFLVFLLIFFFLFLFFLNFIWVFMCTLWHGFAYSWTDFVAVLFFSLLPKLSSPWEWVWFLFSSQFLL